MQLIGYLCAISVGITLGIFGSGGSILTVPIMVYLFNIPPVEATGYSMFVVGLTSTIGGFTYVRKKMVNLRTAIIFGFPSILSVLLVRRFIVPDIPPVFFSGTSLNISRDNLIMLLFAILMIRVSFSMIRNNTRTNPSQDEQQRFDITKLIILGFISGILTGLLGIGGGFIIVPALVLYANVSVRMSVGTSLLIIAFNSLAGFSEELLEKHFAINYSLLMLFSLCSLTGIYIGYQFSLKLNTIQLRKMYGLLMLLTGVFIIAKEFL